MTAVEVMGNRLVQQIVTKDDGFIFISRRDPFPDGNGQLLVFFTVKEKGISVTIIDIVAGLTTRCAMHIQYYGQVFFFTPAYYPVKIYKTLFRVGAAQIFFAGKKAVIKR